MNCRVVCAIRAPSTRSVFPNPGGLLNHASELHVSVQRQLKRGVPQKRAIVRARRARSAGEPPQRHIQVRLAAPLNGVAAERHVHVGPEPRAGSGNPASTITP